MANVRIKDITTTASAPAADDYLAIDGATSGTRKMLAKNLQTETDTTLTMAGKAADAKVTGEYVNYINSDINEIAKNLAVDNNVLAVYQTANNWKLLDSGFCASDTTYKLVKYEVVEGEVLNITSDHKFQFQSVAAVNTSGVDNRIGFTNGVYSGFIIVPTGAHFLVFSTPKENGQADCHATYTIKRTIGEIESVIDDIYITPSNLIDAINAKSGWWVNNDTGVPYSSTDALYAITDYIKINPSTKYANARVVRLWYYTADKTYISTSAGNNTESGGVLTTPSNAEYVIVGFNRSYYVDSTILTANTTIPVTYSAYFEPYVKTGEISVFDKSSIADFTGLPVTGYYKGLGESYSEGFGRTTQANEVITAIDTLVTNYGANYVTKNDLGISSDNINHLYEYVFQPKVPSASPNALPKQFPIVLIVSAQHGFEKSSVYGLYYFMRDLLTKSDDNPVLDYIKNHTVIKIIPIANPYGFNNVVYDNANGVNLNRNYDTSGFPANPSAQPGDSDYGGVTPFDQPETAIIRDWVNDNLNAVLFVDYHTNGQTSAATYERINWIAPPLAKDDFYTKLWYAGNYHISNITAHFPKDYNLNIGTSMCGYMTGVSKGESTVPTADVWVTNQGVFGLTFEGFNGFPNDTAFTADEQKANGELIGNWIVTVLNTFAMT